MQDFVVSVGIKTNRRQQLWYPTRFRERRERIFAAFRKDMENNIVDVVERSRALPESGEPLVVYIPSYMMESMPIIRQRLADLDFSVTYKRLRAPGAQRNTYSHTLIVSKGHKTP